MACNLLSLASFIWHNVFKVHPCCSICQKFCTRCSLSIYKLVNIWIASTFCLLQIVQLGTLLYKFMGEHKFSVLLILCLGIELPGHMVKLFNFWRNWWLLYSLCFYSVLHIRQQYMKIPVSPHSHEHLLLSIFLSFNLIFIFFERQKDRDAVRKKLCIPQWPQLPELGQAKAGRFNLGLPHDC